MDRVFGDRLGNLTGSAMALGQELEYGVRLSALEVTDDHSVAIVWDVAFKSDETDKPLRTIYAHLLYRGQGGRLVPVEKVFLFHLPAFACRIH